MKIEVFGLANSGNLGGHSAFCAGNTCGNVLDCLAVKCNGPVVSNADLVIWKSYDYAN